MERNDRAIAQTGDHDPARHWDALHAEARFRPVYPSEVVVRFLSRFRGPLRSGLRLKSLDIGVGGGRHTRLLCDLGFDTSGVDISMEGLERTRSLLAALGHHADLKKASMADLPFPDDSFDVAVSYGVFNYGRPGEMRQAVSELYRVLKGGGQALVVQRTCDDYRYGKGELLEPDTFLLSISETNEQGTIQNFLSEMALRSSFAGFSRLDYERTETTFACRMAKNSDWLITVEK
jgi:SAM-dependent methyltransferase